MDFAGFVGAVLAPHDGEDAEFGDVGFAAEDFLDAGVFVAGDAVFGGDFGSDSDFGLYGGHFLVFARYLGKIKSRFLASKTPLGMTTIASMRNNPTSGRSLGGAYEGFDHGTQDDQAVFGV